MLDKLETLEKKIDEVVDLVMMCDLKDDFIDGAKRVLDVWVSKKDDIFKNIKNSVETGKCDNIKDFEGVIEAYTEHLKLLINKISKEKTVYRYEILYYTFTQIPTKIEYFIERKLKGEPY